MLARWGSRRRSSVLCNQRSEGVFPAWVFECGQDANDPLAHGRHFESLSASLDEGFELQNFDILLAGLRGGLRMPLPDILS